MARWRGRTAAGDRPAYSRAIGEGNAHERLLARGRHDCAEHFPRQRAAAKCRSQFWWTNAPARVTRCSSRGRKSFAKIRMTICRSQSRNFSWNSEGKYGSGAENLSSRKGDIVNMGAPRRLGGHRSADPDARLDRFRNRLVNMTRGLGVIASSSTNTARTAVRLPAQKWVFGEHRGWPAKRYALI